MQHDNMVRAVVAALQETMSAPAEPEVVPTEVIHTPSPPPNFDTQMANAMAATDATHQQTFQQMQTMMETMQSMNINNDGGSSNHGGKPINMGVGITTTKTMATTVIRATVTTIMETTTATTIMETATTAKMETVLGRTIRQTTAGRMDRVLAREQPAELPLMAIKPPPLGPTALAAVGAISDLLDRYKMRIN